MTDETDMYVNDFDDIDLDNFDFEKPTKLDGNSYEIKIKNKIGDGIYFAIPAFTIEDFNVIKVSKTGFLKLHLDSDDGNHQDFGAFLEDFDSWVLKKFSKNYNSLFGGNQKMSVNTIKKMYAPLSDDTIALRVHTNRRNMFTFEIKDTEENDICIDDLKDCKIIPLVEVKSLFVKSRSFNADIVLRGIVKLDKDTTIENGTSFFEDNNNDVQNSYMDYQTDDETLSVVSQQDIGELNDDLDDLAIDAITDVADVAKEEVVVTDVAKEEVVVTDVAKEEVVVTDVAKEEVVVTDVAKEEVTFVVDKEVSDLGADENAMDAAKVIVDVSEEDDIKAAFTKAREDAKKANEEADRLYHKLLLNMK